MKRILISTVVAWALLTSAPALAGKRPRPTEAPPGQAVDLLAPNELQIYNDYATEPVTYSSRRTDVHYVTRGIDAPPLNDDDSDGVPDYV